MNKRIIYLALVLVFFCSTSYGEEKVYTFGVLNQQSPELTAEKWNPILQYLSKVAGISLKLKMGPTVKSTDDMMGTGEFDFVFTNHHLQKEYQKIGFKTLAKWAGPPIYGVFIISPESKITSLRDLNGKKIAFPSKDAFIAYAVPMVELKKQNIKVEPVFAGNQEGALGQIKFKQVDASAVNSRNLSQFIEREKVQLKEIWKSEPYSEIPVIVHPRVESKVASKVQKALINMAGDPQAKDILDKGKFKGFETATDSEYENARIIYEKLEN